MKRMALILVGVAGIAYWLYRNAGRDSNALDAAMVKTNLGVALMTGRQAANMALSESGLQAIAAREGFSARSYPDASGRSIGFGHFIKAGEFFTEPMSRETATDLLRTDSATAADAVRAYVKVALTQAQFDALVSFVYNVGSGAFRGSTLLKLLNAGDYAGAAAQFPRWNKSGGVVLTALVNRRAQERAQFA